MGPTMVCTTLRPGLKRCRDEFEGEGVEAFAVMKYVSLGLVEVTANTVRAFAFLRRELEDIDIVINTTKTVALPPNKHTSTAEISLRENADVRIVGQGIVTVVGVPIGTDEYVLE